MDTEGCAEDIIQCTSSAEKLAVVSGSAYIGSDSAQVDS